MPDDHFLGMRGAAVGADRIAFVVNVAGVVLMAPHHLGHGEGGGVAVEVIAGGAVEIGVGHGLSDLEDRPVRGRRGLEGEAGRPVLGFLGRPRTAQGAEAVQQLVSRLAAGLALVHPVGGHHGLAFSPVNNKSYYFPEVAENWNSGVKSTVAYKVLPQ